MSHHRFPFPDTYVIVNGRRMHYYHSGATEDRAVGNRAKKDRAMKGRAVVMVHGNYSSAYGYRHFFPYFMAAGWRCFAPDGIGFGGSDKPDKVNVHTFDFHSDNLEIFIRELGLRNVVLVGHEWGGLTALDYAVNRPDNVAGLVLMNSGVLLPGSGGWSRGLWSRSFLGDLLVRRLNLSLRRKSVSGRAPLGAGMTPQVVSRYREPHPTYDSRAAILGFLRMAAQSGAGYPAQRMRTLGNSLPSLSAPALVIRSGGIQVFRPEEAAALERGLPRAEVRLLEGAGYLLHEDAPDVVASWIVGFLRGLKTA